MSNIIFIPGLVSGATAKPARLFRADNLVYPIIEPLGAGPNYKYYKTTNDLVIVLYDDGEIFTFPNVVNGGGRNTITTKTNLLVVPHFITESSLHRCVVFDTVNRRRVTQVDIVRDPGPMSLQYDFFLDRVLFYKGKSTTGNAGELYMYLLDLTTAVFSQIYYRAPGSYSYAEACICFRRANPGFIRYFYNGTQSNIIFETAGNGLNENSLYTLNPIAPHSVITSLAGVGSFVHDYGFANSIICFNNAQTLMYRFNIVAGATSFITIANTDPYYFPGYYYNRFQSVFDTAIVYDTALGVGLSNANTYSGDYKVCTPSGAVSPGIITGKKLWFSPNTKTVAIGNDFYTLDYSNSCEIPLRAGPNYSKTNFEKATYIPFESSLAILANARSEFIRVASNDWYLTASTIRYLSSPDISQNLIAFIATSRGVAYGLSPTSIIRYSYVSSTNSTTSFSYNITSFAPSPPSISNIRQAFEYDGSAYFITSDAIYRIAVGIPASITTHPRTFARENRVKFIPTEKALYAFDIDTPTVIYEVTKSILDGDFTDIANRPLKSIPLPGPAVTTTVNTEVYNIGDGWVFVEGNRITMKRNGQDSSINAPAFVQSFYQSIYYNRLKVFNGYIVHDRFKAVFKVSNSLSVSDVYTSSNAPYAPTSLFFGSIIFSSSSFYGNNVPILIEPTFSQTRYHVFQQTAYDGFTACALPNTQVNASSGSAHQFGMNTCYNYFQLDISRVPHDYDVELLTDLQIMPNNGSMQYIRPELSIIDNYEVYYLYKLEYILEDFEATFLLNAHEMQTTSRGLGRIDMLFEDKIKNIKGTCLISNVDFEFASRFRYKVNIEFIVCSEAP
jgi:hypothetical protein